MFLQVCVCPQGGGHPSTPCRRYPSMPCSRSLGVVSQHALQQVSGGGIPACLAAGLQGGACSRGGACSWGVPVPRGVPPPRGPAPKGVCGGDPLPRPADGYCCGQYASYWNAFLLAYYLLSLTYDYTTVDKICCWLRHHFK